VCWSVLGCGAHTVYLRVEKFKSTQKDDLIQSCISLIVCNGHQERPGMLQALKARDWRRVELYLKTGPGLCLTRRPKLFVLVCGRRAYVQSSSRTWLRTWTKSWTDARIMEVCCIATLALLVVPIGMLSSLENVPCVLHFPASLPIWGSLPPLSNAHIQLHSFCSGVLQGRVMC